MPNTFRKACVLPVLPLGGAARSGPRKARICATSRDLQDERTGRRLGNGKTFSLPFKTTEKKPACKESLAGLPHGHRVGERVILPAAAASTPVWAA
jgi:hypothetical protein